MDEKVKEVRRAYKRKWAQEHPESVRRSQLRFYQRMLAEQDPDQAPEDQDPKSALNSTRE